MRGFIGWGTLILLLWGCPLWAFDAKGHRIVAQTALGYLTPESRKHLQHLLGEQYSIDFVDASQWVLHRQASPDHQYLQMLHFVWFDEQDTQFVADKHCPNNRCAVAAVLESQYMLRQSDSSDETQRRALRYLIHYVADLHQPLNTGLMQDRGGQDYSLVDAHLQPVTLYWVWEHHLMDSIETAWFSLANQYRQQIQPQQIEQWTAQMQPQDWAWESHQLALDVAYGLAQSKQRLDADYIKKVLPVFEQQLQKAAVRLAYLLNDIWAHGAHAP